MARTKEEILREYDDRRIDNKDKTKRRLELEVAVDIRDILEEIAIQLQYISNTMYNK